MSACGNRLAGKRRIGRVGPVSLARFYMGGITLRSAAFGILALGVTGCASVQLDMAQDRRLEPSQAVVERPELNAALTELERQPWTEASDGSEGLVTMLFGGGGPSPRALAEAYLAGFDDPSPRVAVEVRRDAEDILSAAWRVAREGKHASTASRPVKSDLRTVEAAIVETRQCRLVFAEALSMLARHDDTGVDRDEIRRLKQGFNQAILELGRTADTLSERLKSGPVSAYAYSETAF